ncbi:hypothetical protein ACS8Y6_07000 [Salinisphaera sp. RV14]|uniref:hypothetical protein n=1 Tax=unclassified Salinisphaera TaxID=2649847 RepID=UPI003F860BB9
MNSGQLAGFTTVPIAGIADLFSGAPEARAEAFACAARDGAANGESRQAGAHLHARAIRIFNPRQARQARGGSTATSGRYARRSGVS